MTWGMDRQKHQRKGTDVRPVVGFLVVSSWSLSPPHSINLHLGERWLGPRHREVRLPVLTQASAGNESRQAAPRHGAEAR